MKNSDKIPAKYRNKSNFSNFILTLCIFVLIIACYGCGDDEELAEISVETKEPVSAPG
jgi:hypothetical protein